MASGRQQRIREQKRNLFQQKQQVNRLFAQRLSEGMTVAQAATTPYTVTNTDTLESIASTNGVDPTNILDKNPELKNIQTGMVINLPAPGSEAWRVQNAYGGGVGLPSNAALGATSYNLQGTNYFQSEKQTGTYTPPNPFAQREANTFASLSNNAFAASQQQTNRPPYPLYAQSVEAAQQPGQPRAPYPLYAANIQQPQTPTTSPTVSTPGRNRSFAPRGNFGTFINSITAQVGPDGRMPTEFELQYLIEHGRVKPPRTVTGGGGGLNSRGRGRGRRGGGGGGGGRGGSGTIGQERLPAFSRGTGSFSLINWRI